MGDITCELTDDIDLTVAFVTDGQRETQVLEKWSSLYRESCPVYYLGNILWFDEENGVIPAGEFMDDWYWSLTTEGIFEDENPWRAAVADVQVGLFRDQKLVMWYTPVMKEFVMMGEQIIWYSPYMDEIGKNGGLGETRFYVRDRDVVLEKGSVYCEAAVVTDEYGRVYIYTGGPIEYDGASGWTQVDSWNSGPLSPEGWEF